MMIRLSNALGLAAVCCLLSVPANAADPFRSSSDSNVSQSALDAMGLGGMRTLDHDQASEIRGQGSITGFAYVWGRFTWTKPLGPVNFSSGDTTLSAAGHVAGNYVFFAKIPRVVTGSFTYTQQ